MKNKIGKVYIGCVQHFDKGKEALHTDYAPGDFILTHGKSWTSSLIRFGQTIRFKGEDARYANWNHAALIIDQQGGLIEAIGSGVCQRNVADYKDEEYIVVNIVADEGDRCEEVEFAKTCLALEYGFITIISIALSLLTGLKFSFGFEGQFICSGLVARSLERTRAIFSEEPSHIMPADLAKYYKVL